jgi:hypothetical protein
MERASVVPYSLSYRASERADDCASGRSSLRVASNIGGQSRDSLRAFARDIMPAFADTLSSRVTVDPTIP